LNSNKTRKKAQVVSNIISHTHKAQPNLVGDGGELQGLTLYEELEKKTTKFGGGPDRCN
jgi:hypothetical protein